MSILNMLTPWQWLILAAVPPAIIALYFLKLRRQPLEVPSTYLWSRTIEDLHVNSIWQRLRQSLLLFLQLLFLALLILVCLRPGWRDTRLLGNRAVILVDTSASMSATDVEPTRLAAAKQQVLGLIDQMKSDDAAMIISFSDIARVEQPFTNNRSLLRQKLNAIQPTQRTSDLREALRAAAGLANPGRTSDADNVNDIQVADPLPATLYLYTDGGFAAIPDFSLGNLNPVYIPIGSPAPKNVAIAAFSVERHEQKPDRRQAFARLENNSPEDVTARLSLELDGNLADASQVSIPAGESAGVQFDLETIERGALKLHLEHPDHLALDNTAYTAINTTRQARVLLVTPDNQALRLALATQPVQELAVISEAKPADLETKDHQDLAAGGYWDLIIYDRCVPRVLPQGNTFFIGRLPPREGWSQGPPSGLAAITDTDRLHPLMQYVEMGLVRDILDAFPVTAPAGGARLITADVGTLLAVAPRGGFEDAALGFEIEGTSAQGKPVWKTDWFSRSSFPVFWLNVVRYLGGAGSSASTPTVNPGQPIALRATAPVDRITIVDPARNRTEASRAGQSEFVYSNTDRTGVYEVLEGKSTEVAQRFAVNLFDSRESDLLPRAKIDLGHEEITGRVGLEPARRELWKWLLGAGLVVLLGEWYIYNRRVYL